MTEERESGYGWSYRETRERQARLGLGLTPLQRLEWLEATVRELRELEGRTREQREE